MITIDVDFDRTFHGTDLARGREWPPAPARLLAALIAGCHNAVPTTRVPPVREALRRIEESPAPVIVTGPAQLPPYPWTDGYVATKPASRRMTVGTGALRKMRQRTEGRHPEPVLATRVSYLVDAAVQASLVDEAAQGIAYFGTSSDACAVTVREGRPQQRPDEVRWVPLKNAAGASRTWFRGLSAILDDRYQQQGEGRVLPAVACDERVTYVPDRTRAVEEDTMIALSFERAVRGVRPTETLLTHLQQLTNSDSLPLVHADPHHGDGALLGIAVKSTEMVARLIAAVDLGLRFDPAERRAWMQPERYLPPSHKWRTGLPVYAPRERAVARDYLAYLARQQGCDLISHAPTTRKTTGCARATMVAHPRAFVPYTVTIQTSTPHIRPVLSPESLMVPVTEGEAQ